MNRTMLLAVLLLLAGRLCLAQHCAPIMESYLSEIAVKHNDKTLKIHGEYRKRGGQHKDKYQVYVLLYLDQDAAKIPAAPPAALIDPELVLVLHTQLIEWKKDEGYPLQYQIGIKELAQQLRKLAVPAATAAQAKAELDELRVRARLAIFVPWLDDKQYSTLAGLPADKHECNYANSSALLFQQLPYTLDIFQDDETPAYLSINSDQKLAPTRAK